MGKFLVRATITLTALYFVLSFMLAQLYGIDVMYDNYAILFEMCTVVYCFSEGAYHCKYMKYTALSILICDTITRLDNRFDFLSTSAHNIIPILILGSGISYGIFMAIKHFIRVNRIKKQRYAGTI